MTKGEFLSALRVKLCGLPSEEIEERLAFYGEIIDDRREEGLSEAEAVEAIGSLDDVVFDIIGEIPLGKLIKERVRPKRRLKAWEIVLLSLGSPIWLSLIVAAFAVVLSLYVSVLAVLISLWAAFASLAVSAPLDITVCAVYLFAGAPFMGIPFLALGFVAAGLAIFLFVGSLYATKRVCRMTKKMIVGIKKCFMKKEEAR